MAKEHHRFTLGCSGAAFLLFFLLSSVPRTDAKAFPDASLPPCDPEIAICVDAAPGDGDDASPTPVAPPVKGLKPQFYLPHPGQVSGPTTNVVAGKRAGSSGTGDENDFVVTENANDTDAGGSPTPVTTHQANTASFRLPTTWDKTEDVVIVDPMTAKPSEEDDGDVFIVEAISVSVSDRDLATHAAPTVDAAAFGVEAQPRLPLFHDDDDYYEVDLGDDDFLVVDLEAGGRAIGGGHDACSLDKDEGSGGAQVESFYYGGGECHKFTYKGEGGNDNRFDSESACLSTCGTREVAPGCFSSPPRDCGAGCVASFREDRGCHECCCQEKQVNATACALPADGGKCRGFLEQWAFNEATGDCEKFTYGGCGGNDNRFDCKEMCMRNCGNP